MPRKPLVTVLLSVHNDAQFLPTAIESVLGQTYGDFEFLIIDDGSTDGIGDYLRSLRDARVRLLRNLGNMGLTRSLNRGLNAAFGTFVARMDSDDIAMADRLARQVEFLEANPHVGIVGSSRHLIDETGAFVAHAAAVEDDLRIRWKCLLGNPFAHPTVMLRLDVLDAHGLRYDESFRTAQDYELWTRLLSVTRGANLREPLLRYRLRDGISRIHKAEQVQSHDRIAHAAIARLLPGFPISEQEVTELRGRFGGHSVRNPAMDLSERKWQEKYRQLCEAFAATYSADPEAQAA
jgi:glycosyltransferase involved in cell wall biosynthesis